MIIAVNNQVDFSVCLLHIFSLFLLLSDSLPLFPSIYQILSHNSVYFTFLSAFQCESEMDGSTAEAQ